MAETHTYQTPPTRSEWVDRKLREAILSGNLKPGERLVVSALSEHWQVSPTPLREAFQRLAADGLVELVPQRGARVAPVSVTDLLEVYELRGILEPLALRRSLERATPAWRDRVSMTYERLVEVLRERPNDLLELEEHHRRFHDALLSRCDSSWLLRLVATLTEHSVRYRLLSLTPRGGPEEVIGEHTRLLEACLDGEIETAVAHLTQHLRLTVESLAQSTTDGHEPMTDQQEEGTR